MSQTDLLAVAEIAAELRVHPVTVQKLCREGAPLPPESTSSAK